MRGALPCWCGWCPHRSALLTALLPPLLPPLLRPSWMLVLTCVTDVPCFEKMSYPRACPMTCGGGWKGEKQPGILSRRPALKRAWTFLKSSVPYCAVCTFGGRKQPGSSSAGRAGKDPEAGRLCWGRRGDSEQAEGSLTVEKGVRCALLGAGEGGLTSCQQGGPRPGTPVPALTPSFPPALPPPGHQERPGFQLLSPIRHPPPGAVSFPHPPKVWRWAFWPGRQLSGLGGVGGGRFHLGF